MGRCIIFCAAEFTELIDPIQPEDYLLAADGGLSHMQKAGLIPHGINGDFDSLGYVPQGAQVFPVEKDDTDAMLAARKGLSLGFREFVFYGSLDGPRLDHTVANFQTLQFLADHGATGYLVGNSQIVTVLKNGTITFPQKAQGTISLFCMGRDAVGVTLKGLYYPLDQGTLTPGFPLGVSNHFTGSASSVTVEDGSLLIIYPRETGFPSERVREAYT